MPLSGSAFWALILPVEKTNLLQNPSGERGTFGWGTALVSGGGTVGTTSAFQQFGAWAGSCAPTGNASQGGARLGTWTSGNGTTYTASAYIRGGVGSAYALRVASNDESGVLGATTFTTGGTWHRYTVNYTENSDTTRVLTIARNGAGGDAFYFDGAQVEVGSLTTYLDGDQDGCYWLGAPHRSQSVRSGTYRGGGSVVALADLGLRPNDNIGIGMPPQDVTAQSYALQPGAEYQRSRAGERPFTLTFQPILGTTQKDFHVTRRTIINAVKPDLVSPQQPVRFWYTGGQGTVQIDAVYQSGLELGQMNGPMAEEGGIKFVAHDPYWYATTQEGTALSPRTSLGSANALVRRDPLGRWGTVGAHGTSVAGTVDALLMAPTGTLFVGGRITTFDGTTNSRGLAMYYPSTNRFGTMVGTLTPGANRNVTSLVYAPWGSLYIAGQFTLINGTSSRYMAQWNGAFGTLNGGTVSHEVYDIQLSASGSLYAGGNFTSANGTTAHRLAVWMPAGSWGTLNGGTVDNGASSGILALAFGLDQTLYLSGAFSLAGGTSLNNIAQWKNGSFGSMGSGLLWNAGVPLGNSLAVGLNGVLTIGGYFGTAGGVVGTLVAQWNGVSYTTPGGGLGTSAANDVRKVAVRPADGNVYAGGIFNWNSENIPLPDGMAFFNGYTWIPLDIDTAVKQSSGGGANAFAFGPDNSIYVGGLWTGTAYAAAVAQIANTGMGDAYPVLWAKNTGSGTARMYQLLNTLTGDGIYFNYVLLPGEEITLVTEPGKRSFTSSFAGNIFGAILPGSNIASFRLLSGTNYISFFCDSSNVSTSFYWTARNDSVDGGTIY